MVSRFYSVVAVLLGVLYLGGVDVTYAGGKGLKANPAADAHARAQQQARERAVTSSSRPGPSSTQLLIAPLAQQPEPAEASSEAQIPLQVVSGFREDLPDQLFFEGQKDSTCYFSMDWPLPGPVAVGVYPWDQEQRMFSADPVREVSFENLAVIQGRVSGSFNASSLIKKRPESCYQVRLINRDPEQKAYERSFLLGALSSKKLQAVTLVDVNYSLDFRAVEEQTGEGLTAQEERIARAESNIAKYNEVMYGQDGKEVVPATLIIATANPDIPHLQAKLPDDVFHITKQQLSSYRSDLSALVKSINQGDESKPEVRAFEADLETAMAFAGKDTDIGSWSARPLFQPISKAVTTGKGLCDELLQPGERSIVLGEVSMNCRDQAFLHLIPGENLAACRSGAISLHVYPSPSLDEQLKYTEEGVLCPLIDIADLLYAREDYYHALLLDDEGRVIDYSHLLMITPRVLAQRLVIVDGKGYSHPQKQKAGRRGRMAKVGSRDMETWLSRIPEYLQAGDIVVVLDGGTQDSPTVHRVFQGRTVIHIPMVNVSTREVFKSVVGSFTGGVKLYTENPQSDLAGELGLDASVIEYPGEGTGVR